MSKSNGLNSFISREWARRQGGKGSFVPKPTRVTGHMTGTPYKLPDETNKMLAMMRDPTCFRCHGAGITKWKQAGRVACVCACVERKLAVMQEKLEEQKARVATLLAEEKEKAKEALPTTGEQP